MPVIGPTGEFPFDDPLHSEDKGGLNASLIRVTGKRALRMDFGTEIGWVAVSPKEALTMAITFRHIVTEAFGKLSYDASGLPFRIITNVFFLTIWRS